MSQRTLRSTRSSQSKKGFANLESYREKSVTEADPAYSSVQIPHSVTESTRYKSLEQVDKLPLSSDIPAQIESQVEMAPILTPERKETMKEEITKFLMARGCVPDNMAMEQLLKAHEPIIDNPAADIIPDTTYLSAFCQGWTFCMRVYSDMALNNLKKTIEPIMSTLAATTNTMQGLTGELNHTSKLLKLRVSAVPFKRQSPKDVAARINKMKQKGRRAEDIMDPMKQPMVEEEEDIDEESEDVFPEYSSSLLRTTWDEMSDDLKRSLLYGIIKAAMDIEDVGELDSDTMNTIERSLKGSQLTTAYLMKDEGVDRDKIRRYIKKIWEQAGLPNKMEIGD
ncbi:P [Maize fine streak virus]|uniref:P protein n=1 Tax=Maize fine streak virus TaxID=209854 RepID=Q6E0X7_9RHAB|nr:P [Maize fine streak nucleorhabdovirus] [Maize fine streak virus]AAT66745.1 P [Maize fine streak nucleorhabdovirus] [Maize fine streak virus]